MMPSPSTTSPRSSTAIDAVAVAVEGDARARRLSRPPSRCRSAVSVAPQPMLMFVPSGVLPIACTRAPSRSNASGREIRVGPVRAVDHQLEAGQVGAEVLDDVVDVRPRRRPARARSCPCRSAGGASSSALDLLLVLVGELPAPGLEELDAVVLGRVVRRRDHDPEVERAERDRAARKDPAEHGGRSGRGDPDRQRAPSSSTPEPRVSRPMRTRSAPLQRAAARPSRSTRSAVTSSPAMPRTPSVPKYRRAIGGRLVRRSG